MSRSILVGWPLDLYRKGGSCDRNPSVTEIQHVCERMLPFYFVTFSGAGEEPADVPAYEEQQSMGLDYGMLAIDF